MPLLANSTSTTQAALAAREASSARIPAVLQSFCDELRLDAANEMCKFKAERALRNLG